MHTATARASPAGRGSLHRYYGNLRHPDGASNPDLKEEALALTANSLASAIDREEIERKIDAKLKAATVLGEWPCRAGGATAPPPPPRPAVMESRGRDVNLIAVYVPARHVTPTRGAPPRPVPDANYFPCKLYSTRRLNFAPD